MHKKVLFVYNPKAGRGVIRPVLSEILEEMGRYEMECTVHPTKAPGDATVVIREEAGGYDMVVCCGGDGTMDEVVTGLMQGGHQIPLGYLPAGSTNDFANSLGIPRQLKEAARSLVSDEIFRCDIGKLSDRYFVYVAAFGAFTEVSYKTNQDMKNMLGHAAYLLEGLRSIPGIKGWPLRFESEEQSGEGEFIYGMVTNSNSVGGFKGITGHDVTLNDGLFEVTLIRMTDNLIEWPAIIGALLGGMEHDKIITFKTRRIRFISESQVPWTIDGEFGGNYYDVEVENIPEALALLLKDEYAASDLLTVRDNENLSMEEEGAELAYEDPLTDYQ